VLTKKGSWATSLPTLQSPTRECVLGLDGWILEEAVSCGLLGPLELLQVAASDRFFENQFPRVLRAQCTFG